MAIALTRFSQWMLRGDQKQKQRAKRSGRSFRESETVMVNFSSLNPSSPSSASSSASASSSSSRRMHRQRGTSRTKRIDHDRDHDMVIVPSDGGACISGSESDGSDWSIGWLEPHPHDFCTSDAESEDSFAVLVPCYRPLPLPARASASAGASPLLDTREGLSVSESNEFLQHWLSSLASDTPV